MARSTWGSKRQKSRGVWELRYTVGGRPKSSTFRGTAREADRELAALRLRHEGREDTTVTVDAFFWGVFVPECEERVRSAGPKCLPTLLIPRSKVRVLHGAPRNTRSGACRS